MADIQELCCLIARHAPSDGTHATALHRLALIRSSGRTVPMPVVYEPSLCLVAQGRKRAALGSRDFIYDPAQFLVVAVDLPVTGSVLEASPEHPYLSLKLDLDIKALSELMLAHGASTTASAKSQPGLMVSQATPELIDTAVRLLRLLDDSDEARVLAPLVERELLYRLMRLDTEGMLRHIATATSRLAQVSRAIVWMKDNYASVFTVESLAERAGMSPSAFHEHFKAVTSMSPLQYRNELRLREARRLMVSEAADAAAAGFKVGYDSPSQFSRDYARAFGLPPARDAARLRATPDYALGAI
jgi:AraC-like DNA-binding protein